MSNLILDVGQAIELKLAFRRAGYTNEDIKRLCEGSILTEVRRVLRGEASIERSTHIIDCDAQPFVLDGWRTEAHQKGGQFEWGFAKVSLYLDDGQLNGKHIEGSKLRKKLKDQPVLNANVLDYLLVHSHLIPEEWKDQYVFFWGTIYHTADDHLAVRCLFWDNGRWGWFGRSFDGGWYDRSSAAVSIG